MQQTAALDGTPMMESQLRSIEDKTRMNRSAHAPVDDAPSRYVDDKRVCFAK